MPGRAQQVRWTIQAAADEFGCHRATLKTKLRDTEPGTDKLYSTKQIVTAIFGDDSKTERVRLLKEQVRKLQLMNDKAAAEQVDVETVFKVYENWSVAIRQITMASNLTDQEKVEILSNIKHARQQASQIEECLAEA